VNDLIEALTILKKYVEPGSARDKRPTHCEHDELCVTAVSDRDKVSEADRARLDELGFFRSEEDECFTSFRFGSS